MENLPASSSLCQSYSDYNKTMMKHIILITGILAIGLTSCLSPKKTVNGIKMAATIYKSSKEVINKKWAEQRDSLANAQMATDTLTTTPETK